MAATKRDGTHAGRWRGASPGRLRVVLPALVVCALSLIAAGALAKDAPAGGFESVPPQSEWKNLDAYAAAQAANVAAQIGKYSECVEKDKASIEAEDKPQTAQPTTTRGVSALLQGTRSALVPEGSERMARRRLNLVPDVPVEDDAPTRWRAGSSTPNRTC